MSNVMNRRMFGDYSARAATATPIAPDIHMPGRALAQGEQTPIPGMSPAQRAGIGALRFPMETFDGDIKAAPSNDDVHAMEQAQESTPQTVIQGQPARAGEHYDLGDNPSSLKDVPAVLMNMDEAAFENLRATIQAELGIEIPKDIDALAKVIRENAAKLPATILDGYKNIGDGLRAGYETATDGLGKLYAHTVGNGESYDDFYAGAQRRLAANGITNPSKDEIENEMGRMSELGVPANPVPTGPNVKQGPLFKDDSAKGVSSLETPRVETNPNVEGFDPVLKAQQEEDAKNVKGGIGSLTATLEGLSGNPADLAMETKGYGKWDYIRDMSAGLLASDSGTFLGALGDASLLSNANRAKVEATKKKLDADIKIANWKNREDWKKLTLKQKSELLKTRAKANKPAKPLEHKKTTVNGITYKDDIWSEKPPAGTNAIKLPEGTWMVRSTVNNSQAHDFKLGRLTQGLIKEGTTITGQPEAFKATVMDKMMMHNLNRLEENGELNPLLEQMGPDFQATLVDKMVELGVEGEGAEALAIANLMQTMPTLHKLLTASDITGYRLGSNDISHIKDMANTLLQEDIVNNVGSDELINGTTSVPNKISAIMDHIISNANWSETSPELRYNLHTTSQYINNQKAAVRNEDGIGIWNLAKGRFHNNEDSPHFNSSQMEILEKQNPKQFGQIIGDMAQAQEYLMRRGMNKEESQEAITSNVHMNNVLFGGRDNYIVADDVPKYYREDVKVWHDEPQTYNAKNKQGEAITMPVSKLHDRGYKWNAFKGEYNQVTAKGRVPLKSGTGDVTYQSPSKYNFRR